MLLCYERAWRLPFFDSRGLLLVTTSRELVLMIESKRGHASLAHLIKVAVAPRTAKGIVSPKSIWLTACSQE